MIKINKNIITFASIILIVGVFAVIVLEKISPLLSHTVYYCQSYINSISLPIPYQISLLPFVVFFMLLTIAIGRLLFVLLRANMLKRKLVKDKTAQKQFSSILKRLKLHKKTLLIKSQKPFAFCLGIFRPKIYISTAMVTLMDKTELEAILRHEKYHLENKDTFVMLLASVGESLFPFLPLLTDLLRNYRIEREVKADYEAIKELGHSTPIVSVLKKLLVHPSFATVPLSAIADQDTLEPRIKAIVKNDFSFKSYKLKNIFISLLSIVLLSFVMIAPVQAFDLHDEQSDIMMLCPYGDSCAQWCRENKTISPPYSSMEQFLEKSSTSQYVSSHK